MRFWSHLSVESCTRGCKALHSTKRNQQTNKTFKSIRSGTSGHGKETCPTCYHRIDFSSELFEHSKRLGKLFKNTFIYIVAFTITRQLNRAVSPTRTATSLGSSSKRGREAICSLAARLMMVPTDGRVTEHWYNPSSGLSFLVCWTLTKCSEPLANTVLFDKNWNGTEIIIKIDTMKRHIFQIYFLH